MTSFKAPAATYRIQFHRDCGFAAVQKLVPYLHALGITDLYASPLFAARRGSLHGYSVTNPLELNPELGSRAAFDRLVRQLQTRGMGLLLDIVPNHMALSRENPWWQDVLESGPASLYAVFFDIIWDYAQPLLGGKVLIPILGKPYGEALENQELQLKLTRHGFAVHYFDHGFHLDPKSYRSILTLRLNDLEKEIGSRNPAFLGLLGIITMIEHLPPYTVTHPRKLKERHREKEILKERFWNLYRGSPEIKKFIDDNIKIFNGKKGDPQSFNLLDDLLAGQPYRLAFWHVSLDIINYRRFFGINDLIAIRVEDPRVFEATHSLLFKLSEAGKISGIRIDHIDGLYDPQRYLTALQSRLAGPARAGGANPGFYILVEKILHEGEALPPEWPVCGTTGYDFLDVANGLFVAVRGLEELEEVYAAFIGEVHTFADVVYEKKKLIMDTIFGGEVEALGRFLDQLAQQDRYAKDISHRELTEALLAVTACLHVYRTYIRDLSVSPRDWVYLEEAIAEAARRNPSLSTPALDFLRRVFSFQIPLSLPEERKERWFKFVMRWQQFTGPIMAKGLEDTAYYVYNALTSLNEVGSSSRAITMAEFHRFNQNRLERWPFSMNATSTHDTKRSEDVRARLHVLAELGREWGENLRQWHSFNRTKKKLLRGIPVPNANEEVLLYQTLLGAWPFSQEEIPEFQERLKSYAIKAAREAKVNTHWISPNHEYEKALTDFLDAILEPTRENKFLADFLSFQKRLAFWGAINSLAQVLLKIASPGVPDFYQGSELWDLSLVDPDNRRPVDFDNRRKALDALKRQEAQDHPRLLQDLMANWRDGRLKLYLTYKGLNFRKANLDLFLKGEYIPLAASEPLQEHLVAFVRRLEGCWALAAVPRLPATLTESGTFPLGQKAWGDTLTVLPPEAPAKWTNILTGQTLTAVDNPKGRTLPLAQVFAAFPVALLEAVSAP